MSRIERFLAKPIKKTIDGEELEFKPLSTDDIECVVLLQSQNEDLTKRKEERLEGLKRILEIYTLRMFPDSTLEQRKEFAMTHGSILAEAIFEVNGLTPDAIKPTTTI